MSDLPDYVVRNRASWDEWANQYEEAGRRNWASAEPSWGIWGVPEPEVEMLPADLEGLDAIELESLLLHGNAEEVPYPDASFDFALSEYGGFEIEALTEIRPPEDATTAYDFVTREWARQWPSEEVWRARKRG